MTNSFSLDDIRAAADKKYANVEIAVGDRTVKLINALQLPELRRKDLMSKQKSMSEDDANQAEIMEDCIRIVCANESDANFLLEQVGGNLAVLVQIFSSYNKDTELGEA